MEKQKLNYNVALYIRLSQEDGDREESESVTNQRKILRAFAKENKYNIYNEYIDDGYSGTNFCRPAFQKMIKDIEAKKVNMVITKTLSRLGRDYIETGRYIEQYFPEHEVRYIAVLDDVDTYLDKNSEMIAFKNVMNDYYAKETSKNIKRTKYKKIEDGFYYTTFAPFGYKKIDVRGNVVIVESQAQIVRRIFKEFINGKGCYQIAKLLNKEGIPRPASQIQMTSKRYNDDELWNHNAIRRIITNEAYIGNIVQHKKRKISYKSKKEIKVPKEEQIVFQNHHEPIIDIDTWNFAQLILNNHKNNKMKENEHLLKPFIYCGDCYNRMYIIKGGEKYKGVWKYRYHLCCSTSKKKHMCKCPNTYINYDKFEKTVLGEIHNRLISYINLKQFNQDLASQNYYSINNQNNIIKIDDKIKKIKEEISQIERKLSVLYQDRLNEIIDLENYNLFSKDLNVKKEILNNNLKETLDVLDNMKNISNENKIEKSIENCINNIIISNEFSKKDLYHLIKKIEVDHQKNINIIFNFKELNIFKDDIKNESVV